MIKRRYNPYVDIDWENVEKIQAVSHSHFYPRTDPNYHDPKHHSTSEDDYQDDKKKRQAFFEEMYSRGIRSFGLSNYHPPVPDLYPLSEHILDIKKATSFPNAENYGFGEHFNQLGSLRDKVRYDGESKRWVPADEIYGVIYDVFDDIIDKMIYKDAGGITINHPYRLNTTYEKLIKYLNYSQWILGVEVYNYRSERKYNFTGKAFDFWDHTLSNGVQCYGFFVQDMHHIWSSSDYDGVVESRNVLLVPEHNEYEVLKAFSDGRFYGAIHGNQPLKFEKVELTESSVIIETTTGTNIRFISNDGEVVKEIKGNRGSYELDGTEVYVRVEVDDTANKLDEGEYWSQDYETIYSQPFMISPDLVEKGEDLI